MGSMYGQKYVRAWNLKTENKSKKIIAADADLAAQAELLGQCGYKATLNKVRYMDQKPPATPKNGGRKGKSPAKRR